jgi:hypothetical protein
LDVVDHGMKRQSRIGSLRQLHREPSGSICLRAKPSFAHARVPLKHGRHTRVAFCRTAVFGCIEAPPSSPHPVATSIHHRSARRCPTWLFFLLQLLSLHSPRPCRVAGPSVTTLAKVPPCATSLPFVRVGPESPHLTSIRARPNRARSWSALRCYSRIWIRPARFGPFASAWGPTPALARLHLLHRARHRAAEPRCAATSACPASAPVFNVRSSLWRLPRSCASASPEPAPAPALQRAPPALHRASACAHSDRRSHTLGFLARSPGPTPCLQPARAPASARAAH